jgi:predicted transcriptional regulator
MIAPKLSRLELCIEILNAIENQPHSKFNDLQEKIGVDNKSLVYAIDFLEKQDLIKSGTVENETIYEQTPRGLLVTKFFANCTQVVSRGNLVCGTSKPQKDYPL